MGKKAISNVINACYREVGLKETVIFADQLMYTGFAYATRAAVSFCSNDMVIPEQKASILAEAEEEVKEIENQYTSGLVTNGERYNKVVDIWSHTNDQVAKAMMDKLGKEEVKDEGHLRFQRPRRERRLYDGRLRRPWFGGADQAARRYARPHGQAVWRDHRDADHIELQGRPHRAGVLQLHPRRAKGSGRHRPEDRELRLPDTTPCRYCPGSGGYRARLRYREGNDHDTIGGRWRCG